MGNEEDRIRQERNHWNKREEDELKANAKSKEKETLDVLYTCNYQLMHHGMSTLDVLYTYNYQLMHHGMSTLDILYTYNYQLMHHGMSTLDVLYTYNYQLMHHGMSTLDILYTYNYQLMHHGMSTLDVLYTYNYQLMHHGMSTWFVATNHVDVPWWLQRATPDDGVIMYAETCRVWKWLSALVGNCNYIVKNARYKQYKLCVLFLGTQ
jgi:hypothetical protein